MQLLRHLGLAALRLRLLIQLTPDVKALDGPSGPEWDFTDLHAWCEVYLPAPAGSGWTRPPACLPAKATSRWPAARNPPPPPRDRAGGQRQKSIQPSPCGTGLGIAARHQNFHRGAVGQVAALGHRSTSELQRMDVRLTMGGEPTFVATDDPDGAGMEHRRAGPTNATPRWFRPHARPIQGRPAFWPGQSGIPAGNLPRWALSVFWRRMGSRSGPIPDLFADERKPVQQQTTDSGRFIPHAGWPRVWALTDEFVPAFGDVLLPVARAPPAGERGSVRCASGTTRWSATALRRCSPGPDDVVGHICPSSG